MKFSSFLSKKFHSLPRATTARHKMRVHYGNFRTSNHHNSATVTPRPLNLVSFESARHFLSDGVCLYFQLHDHLTTFPSKSALSNTLGKVLLSIFFSLFLFFILFFSFKGNWNSIACVSYMVLCVPNIIVNTKEIIKKSQ